MLHCNENKIPSFFDYLFSNYYDNDILVLPPEENIEVFVTTTAVPTTTQAPTLGTVETCLKIMLKTTKEGIVLYLSLLSDSDRQIL